MRCDLLRCVVIVAALTIAVSPSAIPQTSPATGQHAQSTVRTGPLVTFVELGSVKCIPCRRMQPVMRAIEEKYGVQVKVIFHDVWKDDQRIYAEQFGVKIIPTQVFLDKDGREFFRHEGFFPESEIDKLLQKRGLVAQAGK
jgi:thioredoxin 1